MAVHTLLFQQNVRTARRCCLTNELRLLLHEVHWRGSRVTLKAADTHVSEPRMKPISLWRFSTVTNDASFRPCVGVLFGLLLARNFSSLPVKVVIVDNGSGSCKAGLSDSLKPTVVFPQVVGRPRKEFQSAHTRKSFCGDEVNGRQRINFNDVSRNMSCDLVDVGPASCCQAGRSI